MKIKTLAVVLVFFLVSVTMVHAFGIGAQANFSAGDIFAPGASLLISPADIAHLALNWYLDFDKVNTVGLTLDFTPLTLPIVKFDAGTFNFTLGAGLFANAVFKSDPDFKAGLRIPAGFNLLLGKRAFEIFTHVAPSFGVRVLPSLGLSNPFFPVALGVQLWFR
ncbi:MAG: hypothetical protein FWF26_04955 [Treponema sp.]|nr:hypothetical protein [Treponema sp.]